MIQGRVDQGKEGQVAGMTCPKCSGEVPGASLSQLKGDGYGRLTRTCFGWCLACSIGFEVVQFRCEGNWHVHKYRYYAAFVANRPAPERGWTIVNELPDPAPIVLGPGGDFRQPIELGGGND